MIIKDPNQIKIARGKKNKKKEGLVILCDLDGVMCFWEKAAAETLGIDLEDEKIREEIKNGRRMESYVGGDSAMWSKIDKEGEKWWEDIEMFPWGKDLYEMLKSKSDYFCFLTSPSNSPICAAGKTKWLTKHFGDDFKDFLIGRNKEYCASSRSLLVDDAKNKIKKFRDFGGHAFHWPSALRILDEEIKIEDVMKDLEDYIQEIK